MPRRNPWISVTKDFGKNYVRDCTEHPDENWEEHAEHAFEDTVDEYSHRGLFGFIISLFSDDQDCY